MVPWARPSAGHWAQRGHQAWVLPSRSAPRWLGHTHLNLRPHSSLAGGRWVFGESGLRNRPEPGVCVLKQVCTVVTWQASHACPPLFDKKARMNEKPSSSPVRRPHPDPGTAGEPGPWAAAAASREGRDGPRCLSTCSVPGSVLGLPRSHLLYPSHLPPLWGIAYPFHRGRSHGNLQSSRHREGAELALIPGPLPHFTASVSWSD